MSIATCFKAVLYSIMKMHIGQLIRIISISNCSECLNAIPPDETHDCWRLRNRLVRFERHHLIFYFTGARETLFNLILRQPFLQNIKNLLYIHLYPHNHPTQEIHDYITDQRIIDAASSIQASTRIFQCLWENHPDSAATTTASSTTTTAVTSTITSSTTTANSTVTSTTMSSGRPLVTVDLTEHSPDEN